MRTVTVSQAASPSDHNKQSQDTGEAIESNLRRIQTARRFGERYRKADPDKIESKKLEHAGCRRQSKCWRNAEQSRKCSHSGKVGTFVAGLFLIPSQYDCAEHACRYEQGCEAGGHAAPAQKAHQGFSDKAAEKNTSRISCKNDFYSTATNLKRREPPDDGDGSCSDSGSDPDKSEYAYQYSRSRSAGCGG